MARSESRSAPAPHDPDCVLARCARFGRCEVVISPNRLGVKPLSGHFGTGPLLLLVQCVPATIPKTEDCETFGSRARGQSLHQGISPNAISPLDAGRGNVVLVATDRIARGTEEPTLSNPANPSY